MGCLAHILGMGLEAALDLVMETLDHIMDLGKNFLGLNHFSGRFGCETHDENYIAYSSVVMNIWPQNPMVNCLCYVIRGINNVSKIRYILLISFNLKIIKIVLCVWRVLLFVKDILIPNYFDKRLLIKERM